MLIIIVPAYNEEKNIGTLLDNILAMGYKPDEYRVLVIDDGSLDATVDIARSFESRMPVRVVSHSVNLGVGAVFRTGFAAALANARANDVIITMEADNTSDLSILPEMVRRVNAGNPVILASCYAKGGQIQGTNLWRKLISRIANLLLFTTIPIPGVKTYSSFYRAYNADVLQRAIAAYANRLIEQSGFVCMAEVLVKLNRIGVRFSEVPMILRIDRRQGRSKMRVVRTIQDYIKFILTDIRQRKSHPSALEVSELAK